MTQAIGIEISLCGTKSIQQINIWIKTLALDYSADVGNVFYVKNSEHYMIPLVVPVEKKEDLIAAVREHQKKAGFILVNENIYE